MNRRGFVVATVAGVSGFFFPQKIKADENEQWWEEEDFVFEGTPATKYLWPKDRSLVFVQTHSRDLKEWYRPMVNAVWPTGRMSRLGRYPQEEGSTKAEHMELPTFNLKMGISLEEQMRLAIQGYVKNEWNPSKSTIIAYSLGVSWISIKCKCASL